MSSESEIVWPSFPPPPAVDEDVVPFPRVVTRSPAAGRNNKKHHLVSVTYMDGFAADGRVWAYHDDRPDLPQRVRPPTVGYEKFYYSQKLPDGSRENHRFEDLWGVIEGVWPVTRQALRDRRLSPAISLNTLGMATILRARVPAARERHELLMAAELRGQHQALERMGKLPPELARYAGQLDIVPVAANPQRSLGKMREDFAAFHALSFRMGFEVLHAPRGAAFVTSDNPVCWYDPTEPFDDREPYPASGDIELLFPLDAGMLLRGSTRLVRVNQIVRHRTLVDRAAVRRFNRTIAQFSYRLLLAQGRCDDLALRHMASSPTVDVAIEHHDKEILIIVKSLFAPRPRLPLFVDTPEKAERMQAKMIADGFSDTPMASPEGIIDA